MQADIARYSKLIFPKDTGHNEEREEKLLQRCPPGHEGTMLIDKPATIVDVYGAIIAWYLPDALTNATQVCKLYFDLMDIISNGTYRRKFGQPLIFFLQVLKKV
jgi:hypothetical protein